MTQIEMPLNLGKFEKDSTDLQIINEAIACREAAALCAQQERWLDAMERTVTALRAMRDFSDFDNIEFRALLVSLIFDLAEIHYSLKDYKQSEKELDTLFKVLDNLVKLDEERFGKFHILAMELSTRILRSRKKALDLLVKQQMNAGALYEKVNSGVAAATDKLVDTLRNVGELLASTGDIRGALKFYAEAIKYSKKRAGRVTRKEVKMTIEMAEIMMRNKTMRPRALRLLEAILPHAISLEIVELEQEIISLKNVLESNQESENSWKQFFRKITLAAKSKFKKGNPDDNEESVGDYMEETVEGSESEKTEENVDDTEH
ncbi:MAG: hypothetical protein K2M63_02540 [Muribaculaceae bacterium]|nr:hypothetical protein [Muribaculaceae bacterium]